MLGRLSICCLLLVLVGCASHWEKYYSKSPFHENTRFTPTKRVQVRTVDADRLNRAKEVEYEIARSGAVAMVDWSPQEQLAHKNRLLEALQLRERGDEASIIGWISFASTERLDVTDGKLEEFARRQGAHYAVVAVHHRGTVDQVVRMPVTSYGFSSGQATAYGSNGSSASAYGSEFSSATSYVPVKTQADQLGYDVVLVRRNNSAP